MSVEPWRELLEPPRGGLARLQATIESAPRPRRPPWALALAAAFCITTAVALLEVPQFMRRERLRATLTAALTLPADVVVERGAALELPSRRADVRIVFVAALPPPAPTSR